VEFKGCYEDENEYWIVQEYCEAGSLADLQKFHTTFSEKEISVILGAVLRALAVLHGRNRIHRDIKAANILINVKGQCKLADFGVSAQVNSTNGCRATVTGTPYWMAPEVLGSQQYNNKADIWSLGITCIELATGSPPYSNLHPMQAMFKIVQNELPTLPQGLSSQLKDFISKCLVKKAEERPTVEELLKHPFLLTETSTAVLTKLIEQNLEKILAQQTRKRSVEAPTMRKNQDDGKVSWDLDTIDDEENVSEMGQEIEEEE